MSLGVILYYVIGIVNHVPCIMPLISHTHYLVIRIEVGHLLSWNLFIDIYLTFFLALTLLEILLAFCDYLICLFSSPLVLVPSIMAHLKFFRP